MRCSSSRSVAGGVVVGVLLLTGCTGAAGPRVHGGEGGGGGTATAAPAASAPAGLSGDLVQQRRDVETGSVQVELSLGAGVAALDLSAVHLRTDAFPDAAPGEGLVVQPGLAVDVPIALGAPACPEGGDADGSAPTSATPTSLPATAVLALADGTTADLLLPDAAGYLARLHTTACTAQRTAAVVPAAWDPAWTTTGEGADLRAVGVLHLGPVAAGHRVELAEVVATTLFRWRLRDAALPLVLGAGRSADVAVVLDPARCDAHAVADDKRGFGPELVLAVDGDEPVRVRAWVPRDERATATDALVARGAAGGWRDGLTAERVERWGRLQP